MLAVLIITTIISVNGPSESSDIDEFIKEVYDNREAGWALLLSYNFTEDANITISNRSTGLPLQSRKEKYVWFTREGKLVRSPVISNGAGVPEGERLAYEDEFLNGGKKGKRRADLTKDGFFNLTYEPGTYFYAGEEMVNGRETVIIEYYPREHFTKTGRDPIGNQGDKYDPSFDKTSLVKMWIDRDEKQIVKVDFQNASLDYLPGSWLVSLDFFNASLTMKRNQRGDWLPHFLTLDTVINQAEQSLEISLERSFSDYRRTGVNVDFDFRKKAEEN